MQKFVDQTISANTNYDPSKFEDGKLPLQKMIQDILTTYKLGIKTLYYHNTRDGSTDAQIDTPVESTEDTGVDAEEIPTIESDEHKQQHVCFFVNRCGLFSASLAPFGTKIWR